MTVREFMESTLRRCDTNVREVTPLAFHAVHTLLKCPVVGICLSRQEQQKILKKSGWWQEGASDFDIHELLVSQTDTDTALPRAVHGVLHRKFGAQAKCLQALPLPELIQRWDAAFAAGQYGAELWALATLPDLPIAVQRYVFGCVHMGMHHALERCAQLERTTATLQKTCMQEQERRKQSRLAHNALRREYDSVSQKHQRLRRAHELLQAECVKAWAALRQHQRHAHPEAHDMQHVRDALHAAQEQTAAAHTVIAQLQGQLDVATQEMRAQRTFALELQKEIGMLLKATPECEACTQCQEDGATCAHCPRRILIVGGINRMESLYRRLVEARGGALEYHDGCMAGGDKRLEGSLQRADLVLCPVNCNSHTACLLVKRLCKKYNKPVQMMSNFSLSAISRAIAAS